jgi:hypothetical protein
MMSEKVVVNVVCTTPEQVKEAITLQALDKLIGMVDELARDKSSSRVIQKMRAVLGYVVESAFPELDKRIAVIEEERKHRQKIRDFNFVMLRKQQLSTQLQEQQQANAGLIRESQSSKSAFLRSQAENQVLKKQNKNLDSQYNVMQAEAEAAKAALQEEKKFNAQLIAEVRSLKLRAKIQEVVGAN